MHGELEIKDLALKSIDTRKNVFECIQRGEQMRHVGATRMNDRSSRSHTIFRVNIVTEVLDKETREPTQSYESVLQLVDL